MQFDPDRPELGWHEATAHPLYPYVGRESGPVYALYRALRWLRQWGPRA